jgi:membrane protein implicated in regulation of membrane protease activity
MIYLLFLALALLGFGSALSKQAYVAAIVCSIFACLYAWLFQKYLEYKDKNKSKGS